MIWSIGYQRLSRAESLNRIISHLDIDLLIDTRRSPYSRNPEFSLYNLQRVIQEQYISMPQLGGQQVQQTGLDFLREHQQMNLLLLCLEEAPGECHRHHEIAVQLLPEVDIAHIYRDHYVFASDLQKAIERNSQEYNAYPLPERNSEVTQDSLF